MGNNYKHGHRNSREGKPSLEYNSWASMKRRICLPTDTLYPYYGGRGIDMDPTWKDFSVFLNDMGKAPSEKHSLERIDNNKGYWKHNVKWGSKQEQARNKRTTVWVDWLGEKECLADVCEKLKWKYKTVHRWYKEGKTFGQIQERANQLWAKDQIM